MMTSMYNSIQDSFVDAANFTPVMIMFVFLVVNVDIIAIMSVITAVRI